MTRGPWNGSGRNQSDDRDDLSELWDLLPDREPARLPDAYSSVGEGGEVKKGNGGPSRLVIAIAIFLFLLLIRFSCNVHIEIKQKPSTSESNK